MRMNSKKCIIVVKKCNIILTNAQAFPSTLSSFYIPPNIILLHLESRGARTFLTQIHD